MLDPSQPLLSLSHTDIFVRGGPSKGDVTRSEADVIVSSAGTDASMSDGVSAAILNVGGREILSALQAHRPLVPGDERRVLQASVWRVISRCMDLAQRASMASIAFPSLGMRDGGADRFETHSTMAAACLEAIRADTSLRRILFCFDWPPTAQTFRPAFLQQRLVRQALGLSVADAAERDELTQLLPKVFEQMLKMNAKVEQIQDVVQQLEKNPSTKVIKQIIGTYVEGNVTVDRGGKFVGGDDYSKTEVGDAGK
jgi:O-acetyl-ADP-ribose deacetylase (regulator of RNase III)